uniref:Uncharacterized protein n=1 Tax=uncultured bacterium A1Q1_fos_2037 TaxID=1256558 RepID=L7VYD2_9BACT|nr:hypothetical protein [uncultured bacterium A1Q1_fos_2037]
MPRRWPGGRKAETEHEYGASPTPSLDHGSQISKSCARR